MNTWLDVDELVSSWLYSEYAKRYEENVLEKLKRLRILDPRSNNTFGLHASFKRHLQYALSRGTCRMLEEVPEEARNCRPSDEEVEGFAQKQWEKVLLLSITNDGGGPVGSKMLGGATVDLSQIFLSCGIIGSQEDDAGVMSITQEGFQFLLSDTYTQVWQIIREYLVWVEECQSSEAFNSVVEFMLQLGFESECIPTRGFTKEQMIVSSHMCQLGLLYPFSHDGAIYLVPTKLAVMLSSGGTSGAQDDGYVIVETNYRVYAYTSSAVKQAILRLFVRCDVLLPNLLVGTITRESVMSALDSGVTADQIIGYLIQHAHKHAAAQTPVVPGVVVDQIRLWQKDLQRMRTTTAVLYKNFETRELYEQVASYAASLAAILTRNDSKQEFVAISSFHDQIRSHIKHVKQNM